MKVCGEGFRGMSQGVLEESIPRPTVANSLANVTHAY